MSKNNVAAKIELAKPAHAEPEHFIDGGHVSKSWSLTIDADVPYTRIFEPEFWKKVARYVHLHDEIKVRDVAGTYWAWLLVVNADVGRNHVQVVELLKKTLTPVDVEPYVSGDMIARYEGPIKMWTVRRVPDNVVLAERISDRNEARYQMISVIPARAVA